MCGRYTIGKGVQEAVERFKVQLLSFEFESRYNVAPSQPIPVITDEGQRALDGYRWGLVPSWAKDPSIGHKMINARAETVAEKPSYRTALLRRRCLIPADGFYEWRKDGEGRNARKQPIRIRRKDSELFAFAGLWDEWCAPDGSPIRTCTIITTQPNELMQGIHNRMPAILRPEDEDNWIGGEVEKDELPFLLQMLRPLESELLVAEPVSLNVNSPAYDMPDCIQPIED
jgi:putative SOS response-associated peptidase YedK